MVQIGKKYVNRQKYIIVHFNNKKWIVYTIKCFGKLVRRAPNSFLLSKLA